MELDDSSMYSETCKMSFGGLLSPYIAKERKLLNG